MAIPIAAGIRTVSYHQVPHIYLGTLFYFEDCRLYIFFPNLYDEDTQRTFLIDVEYEQFMNFLLHIQGNVYDSLLMQHFPSSWADAACKDKGRGSEQGIQADTREPCKQMLHYILLPSGLHLVWNQLQDRLSSIGFHDLDLQTLLLNAKNMKTLFRSEDPGVLLQQFLHGWNFAIDDTYLVPNQTLIDIGKEVVASKHENMYPQTYLWKTCCLKKTLYEFHLGIPKSGFVTQFYPWALTGTTCNMTFRAGKRHPFTKAGLMYSQFYSSTKEIFNAAKIFPFNSTSVEGLTVDPTLYKLWNKDTGRSGGSWDRGKLQKAYLTTKNRLCTALQSSQKKCCGMREEHRMSWTFFQWVGKSVRQLPATQYIDASNPPCHLLSITLMCKFLYSNMIKFGYGFEYVLGKDCGIYISTETMKVATMFLHLLRVSLGGVLLAADLGLWIDIGIHIPITDLLWY